MQNVNRDLTHFRRRRQGQRLFKSVFTFHFGISHLRRSFQCVGIVKLGPAEYQGPKGSFGGALESDVFYSI